MIFDHCLVVTSVFDLLISKFNNFVFIPSYTDIANLVKFRQAVCKISCLLQSFSFLTDLFIIQITYSTDCYHRPQQRLNDTILEAADTHSSYQSTTLACQTRLSR